MILRVQDILKDAMGLIGATQIDETPSASELATALRIANVMLARWSSQHLVLRSPGDITFSLQADKQSYTIGLGTDLVTLLQIRDVLANKPIALRSASVVDNGLTFPVEIVNKDMFGSFIDLGISPGRPRYVCFDPGIAQQTDQYATTSFYPIPEKDYVFTGSFDQYLQEFVNFTDIVEFEPAYYEALIYGIAIRLFRRYHSEMVQIPQDLVSIANNAFEAVRVMNSVTPVARLDVPSVATKYNIYTDC